MSKRKPDFRNICRTFSLFLLLLSIFTLAEFVCGTSGSPHETYYASNYNILNGTWLSGSVPASVQNVDTNYFIVRSSGTATSTTAHNPSSYTLVGSTTHVSGAVADVSSNNGVYMAFRSYTGETIYAHQETATIGGSTYYLLKPSDVDAEGMSLSASSENTGRKLMGKFVYQLVGVFSIPASTWTIYYRAQKTSTGVSAHADVDILIRMANGTVRTTVAINVANSGNLTSSWSTLAGVYSWGAYTVVDPTDYLEIDYYIEVTTGVAASTVRLKVDDISDLAGEATRAENIMLTTESITEIEFVGTSNPYNWDQLDWSVDSAWITDNASVTLQLYNYTLGGYPTSGDGFISYTSSATANTDETKIRTITTNSQHFRDATGNWKIKVKGVKTTTTQLDFKVDWIEFKPTYYSEYTVSTEFLFSSMTTNAPTQLSLTVVSQFNVPSVFVTIQVWNYSSSAYATSGEGCLTYISSGTNETKTLSITANSQYYTSNGNATIKITGILSTAIQYQQEINQIVKVSTRTSVHPFDWAKPLLYILPILFALPLLFGLKRKRKKKAKPRIEKKTDGFSQQFGMTHEQIKGKKMLFEIDPASDYHKSLVGFVSEAEDNNEPLFIFTNKNSTLHSALSGVENVNIYLLTSKTSSPQQIDDRETLLPASDLSVLLDAFDRIQKGDEKPINVLFDNVSDIILRCGFEKTYRFTRLLLETFSSSKTTAIFVFNPEAHDQAISSSIRGLFENHLAYTKNGPKVGTS